MKLFSSSTLFLFGIGLNMPITAFASNNKLVSAITEEQYYKMRRKEMEGSAKTELEKFKIIHKEWKAKSKSEKQESDQEMLDQPNEPSFDENDQNSDSITDKNLEIKNETKEETEENQHLKNSALHNNNTPKQHSFKPNRPIMTIEDCKKESQQKVVDDYLTIVEEFDKQMENGGLAISEPIYGDKGIRSIMVQKLFKPCPAYIQQVKNFKNQYEMKDSRVFREFLENINPNLFNQDTIYNQVLDSSGWEYIMKQFATVEAKAELGEKSKSELKNIVNEAFQKFIVKYRDWANAGRVNVNNIKQSVTIQLNECDEDQILISSHCLNLVGVLMIKYIPKKKKAGIELIGGTFRTEYTKTKTTPMNDIFSRIGDDEKVKKLEFIWSYHKNLAKIRNNLQIEYSHLFKKKPLTGFNTDSFNEENCGNQTIPASLSTHSDCAEAVAVTRSRENWSSGRKRREAPSLITDRLENDDTFKCILLNETNCENSHHVQKRSNRSNHRANKNKFTASFYDDVYEKVKLYANRMDPKDFERSACMLDKYKSDQSKKVRHELEVNIPFNKIQDSFAGFLVNMFGNAKICSDCKTTILKEYFPQFKQHIEKIENDIKSHFTESYSNEEQHFERRFDLEGGPEMAFIQYYIVYEIVDFQNTGKVNLFACLQEEDYLACQEKQRQKHAAKTTAPEQINIAYYAYYSEYQLKRTSMDENKIIPLTDRFKDEIMKKYFQYEFVTDLVREMPVEYDDYIKDQIKNRKKTKIDIKGENHILRVMSDIKYPTSWGICRKVIKTFENCYNKNGSKRHFIFLIDGSGSVSDNDFNNMKESIKSMLNYPLNGQNLVSIVEFSSTQQKLCHKKIDPDLIHNCIYSKSKLDWGTDINGAIDYAVQDYIKDESTGDLEHVVVIFTDGEPNSTVRYKVAELRNMQNVKVTGFGIGDAFESASALRELGYITGEQNLQEHKYKIRNFDEFERNRLDLQNTICSA